MPAFRPVVFIGGILVLVLSATMAIPALVELALEADHAAEYLPCVAVPLFLGATAVLASRGGPMKLGLREAYLLTSGLWFVLPMVAALPFMWTVPNLSLTDAYFEAVSGLTTTGSTVITGLDDLPPGVLLWRSMLQWVGGIGIVMMAVAVLPLLRVGGMQLMSRESSDTSDKILARPRELATWLLSVYLGMTILAAIAYGFAGMGGFDALNHAMTTVSTAGFSTRDTSLGSFSPAAQWVSVVFMLAGAAPFLLYVQVLRGTSGFVPWSQIPPMLGVVAVGGGLLAYSAIDSGHDVLEAIRHGVFTVTSIITTTGYASYDWQTWGPIAAALALVLSFCGGCTGSTTGGVKIFRWQVLIRRFRITTQELIRPHRVVAQVYQGRPVGPEVVQGVMGFVLLVGGVTALVTVALAATGLDLVTAFSTAATAVTNVGPALGTIAGPAGTFAPLPDTAKWILSFAMLLGRLELLTVLVMLDPDFWKR
ncbi:TrkH family potassium uptake protein [Thalassobaculum sp.]|uniref:TrkH family potassium uptake protein n=1 Tax=Thalassobaculum sp. TaxID=2022740 RepID=UPI0032EF3B71